MELGMTLDCANPVEVARFWQVALGYVEAPVPTGFESWEAWFEEFADPEDEPDSFAALVDPAGVGPRLSFLRVPEAKTVKNRLHLDLRVSGGRHVDPGDRRVRIQAEVERVVAAGASVLTEHRNDGQLDHVVMADPEGNEFCIV